MIFVNLKTQTFVKCTAHVRHVGVAVAAVVAPEVALRLPGRRRRRQAEEGAVGACRRREHGGGEERVLGGAGLDVGAVELLDAGVQVADATHHGVLPDQLDRHGDGQREEGEEEVDDLLARLREQHPLRLPVDEELHAQRGRGRGCCHLVGSSSAFLASQE